ncbi:MAG: ABC transporter ATP-binding protein [Phycisphaerales bacterium]
MSLIACDNLSKTYRLGRVDVPVLRGVSLAVNEGEWVAIVGASGSGKSTLLHLMGGLDRPDAGSGGVQFKGEALGAMNRRALDRFRCVHVGFVFQFYHLLPELTVLENALAPAMIRHRRLGFLRHRDALREQATALLGAFGLAHRLKHRPAELSGGERQRVAIARAMLNEPDVLLADEPTGNLDRATGAQILDAITGVRKQRNQTIVMVTHDAETAARADRRLSIVDGRIVEG